MINDSATETQVSRPVPRGEPYWVACRAVGGRYVAGPLMARRSGAADEMRIRRRDSSACATAERDPVVIFELPSARTHLRNIDGSETRLTKLRLRRTPWVVSVERSALPLVDGCWRLDYELPPRNRDVDPRHRSPLMRLRIRKTPAPRMPS